MAVSDVAVLMRLCRRRHNRRGVPFVGPPAGSGNAMPENARRLRRSVLATKRHKKSQKKTSVFLRVRAFSSQSVRSNPARLRRRRSRASFGCAALTCTNIPRGRREPRRNFAHETHQNHENESLGFRVLSCVSWATLVSSSVVFRAVLGGKSSGGLAAKDLSASEHAQAERR